MREGGPVAGSVQGSGGSGVAGRGGSGGGGAVGSASDGGGGSGGRPGGVDWRGLLNRTEARAYLGGIGATLLWRLEVDGDLRAVRIGRRVMYRREDLDRFIERQARGGSRRAV